jgi:type II secretory pathway pseudopilin PulG
MMRFSSQQAGYSLVETLVAIAVLLFAVTSSITIVTSSLRSALFVSEQATAVFLAQEGIEAVHAYRNSYAIEQIKSLNPGDPEPDLWAWINDNELEDCFTDGCNISMHHDEPFRNPGRVDDCGTAERCVIEIDETPGRSVYVGRNHGDTESKYTRVIRLEQVFGQEAVRVTVTVTWRAQLFADDHSVVLETILYNYGS